MALLQEQAGILPESGKTEFYPALDGIRTIAVAMVIGVHYRAAQFPLGWMGVQLFFVLSGFLITGILFDTRHSPHRVKNFYARRMLRIFPLYYGFLAVVVIALLWSHTSLPRFLSLWAVYLENFFWLLYPGISDVLRTATGKPITAIGHFWSLAVEEQFYLVWPLLIFTIKDRKRLMQLCMALIVGRLLLAVYWQGHLSQAVLANGLIYRMLPTQADGFLMGGLIALWMRGARRGSPVRATGWIAGTSLLAYAVLLLAVRSRTGLCGGDCYGYSSGFQAMLGIPLCNAVAAAMVLAATQAGTWVHWICNWRVMRSLGKVSYGIYVYHVPLFILVPGLVQAQMTRHGFLRHQYVLSVVVGLASTVLISYASFYLYEKPFLRFKNRFTSIHEGGKAYAVSRL